MTVHVPDPKTIEAQSLAQLFTEARTHNAFRDKPVSDELLQKAIELAKMGPTSANQSPHARRFLAIARGQGATSASAVCRQSGQDHGRAGRRDHGLRRTVL